MSLWRQFRQTHPLFIPVLISVAASDLLLRWMYAWACDLGAESPFRIGALRNLIYGVAAIHLGMFRLFNYPTEQRGYLRWLRTTPWTPDKPLPLGPVLPAWQDAVVIAALWALAISGSVHHVAWTPAAYLAAYAFVGTVFLAAAQRWLFFVAAIVTAIAAVQFVEQPWTVLAFVSIGMAIVWCGLWQLLWKFHSVSLKPWEADLHDALLFRNAAHRPRLKVFSDIGPMHRVPHRDKIATWERKFVLLLAVLMGVVEMAILWHSPELIEACACATIGIVVVSAILRLLIYLGIPPISLKGRVLSGHWIIPRYDRACLVPIGSLIVSYLVWRGLSWAEVPLSVVASVTLTVGIAVAFALPPSQGVHFLTGAQHYRIWGTRGSAIRVSAPAQD